MEKESSINDIYKGLTVKRAFSVLEAYLGHDTAVALRESNFVDLREFTAFFLWLVNVRGYKVQSVGLVHDPETREPLFLAVYINCTEAEWRSVSMSVKEYMKEQGFGKLAGRVALLCKD